MRVFNAFFESKPLEVSQFLEDFDKQIKRFNIGVSILDKHNIVMATVGYAFDNLLNLLLANSRFIFFLNNKTYGTAK